MAGLDVDIEILSSDRWTANRLIADRYSAGRIFLIGDACHQHPPFGGYGMNMGIGDGVDLGWKLAGVIQGWAGEELLQSYESERKPIHTQIMAEAEANHSVLSDHFLVPGLEAVDRAGEELRAKLGADIAAKKYGEFNTLGAVLGYRYGRSRFIPDGGLESDLDAQHYTPSSEPGCLAPHYWLDETTSLYDRFGAGFTLLSHKGVRTSDVAEEAAELGIPFRCVPISGSDALSLYPAALTLVRPDQHVSWRGDRWPRGLFRQLTARSSASRGAGAPGEAAPRLREATSAALWHRPRISAGRARAHAGSRRSRPMRATAAQAEPLTPNSAENDNNQRRTAENDRERMR